MIFATVTEPLSPEQAEAALIEAYIQGLLDGVEGATKAMQAAAELEPGNDLLAFLIAEMPGLSAALVNSIRAVLADPEKMAKLKAEAAQQAMLQELAVKTGKLNLDGML